MRKSTPQHAYATNVKSLCRKECRKPSSVVESWFWIWFQQPAVGKSTALLLYAVVDDLFVSAFQFSKEKSFQVACHTSQDLLVWGHFWDIATDGSSAFPPILDIFVLLIMAGIPKVDPIPRYANSQTWQWVPWVRKFHVDSSLPLRSFKDVRWRSVWMHDHKLDWGFSATTMIT